MKRLYLKIIEEHFASNSTQALFLSGPRQVGKTTIAKEFLKECLYTKYLNWDNLDHRQLILQGPAAIMQGLPFGAILKEKPLICFDEIHKYKEWKSFLKGFIDTYREEVKILVTGSARLHVFNKGGESLMGRYFLYRVHPLSLREIITPNLRDTLIGQPVESRKADFNKLLTFGGFPDPFIRGEQPYYRKWQRLRHQQFFQGDIRELSNIHELSLLEVLAALIRHQAGQLSNLTSLARKVRVSDQTIRRWISVFESMYFCFTLRPWSNNITRSLLKEPKIYLWDWSQVEDLGQRNENFIAAHLLKAINFWNDSGMGDFELYFLKTKDQQEVDFLITKQGKPWVMLEVKSSSEEPLSPHLLFFQKQLHVPHVFQVAMDLPYVEKDCFSLEKPTIVPAKTFLSQLV